MFNLMKPGHVLRFATCPSTIISPPAADQAEENDNTLMTAWPTISHLGVVQVLSHPSGNIGPIATHLATHLRTTPGSNARSASYSAAGQFLTESNRAIGQAACDFVGYVDGQSNFIQSTETVFSKDFSGCLMVAYTIGGVRHVAHAAASAVPAMDCKQAFLTALQGAHATLLGWFRPFTGAVDSARKINAMAAIGNYIAHNIDRLSTFGVITQAGQAYAIDAFKPTGVAGNDWVVTYVSPKVLSHTWNVP